MYRPICSAGYIPISKLKAEIVQIILFNYVIELNLNFFMGNININSNKPKKSDITIMILVNYCKQNCLLLTFTKYLSKLD